MENTVFVMIHDEHIDHIISYCSELAKADYLIRHNKVCTYLQWAILKGLGATLCEKCIPLQKIILQSLDYDFPVCYVLKFSQIVDNIIAPEILK